MHIRNRTAHGDKVIKVPIHHRDVGYGRRDPDIVRGVSARSVYAVNTHPQGAFFTVGYWGNAKLHAGHGAQPALLFDLGNQILARDRARAFSQYRPLASAGKHISDGALEALLRTQDVKFGSFRIGAVSVSRVLISLHELIVRKICRYRYFLRDTSRHTDADTMIPARQPFKDHARERLGQPPESGCGHLRFSALGVGHFQIPYCNITVFQDSTVGHILLKRLNFSLFFESSRPHQLRLFLPRTPDFCSDVYHGENQPWDMSVRSFIHWNRHLWTRRSSDIAHDPRRRPRQLQHDR